MARDPLKYLEDIRLAAEDVFQFTRGRTLHDYQHDPMLKAAVERKFEIMGEAICQLDEFRPDWVEQISEHPQIIGFRNRLIHGYFNLNDASVWTVVEVKLAVLVREVEALLKKHG